MLATIQFRTYRLQICYLKKVTIKIYKTITFPIVLHGFETWCTALKEGHRQGIWKVYAGQTDEMGGAGSTNGGEEECI
jgi:hypothetical protein